MKIKKVSEVDGFDKLGITFVFVPINSETDFINSIITEYKLTAFTKMISNLEKKHLSKLELQSDDFSSVNIVYIDENKASNLNKSNFIKCGIEIKASVTESINIDVNNIENIDLAIKLCKSFVTGLFLGTNDTEVYKTDKKEYKRIEKISFISTKQNEKEVNIAIANGFYFAESINKAINLVNAPSNFKTPETLAQFIIDSSKNNGFSINILEKDDLEKQGFDALLAVNRGSEIPAKFLIGEYRTENATKKTKTIILVGKGVTFDTGGISMKGPANMHYMKSDMGGAAAVLGTIDLVSKLKLNVNLIALVPTTDNSVDALSINPGDVISSYSKKTIEVIDTDAEGRLVLADGLAYAVKNYKADHIIDLATLTGSVVRSLGTEAAGIMTNNQELFEQLSASGDEVGERVWRLPLWEEYFSHMQSDIADIKNLSAKPMAGAITAGKFLEFFTENHPSWAHLDIAGTAFGSYPTTKGYSATGFGIELLTNWITIQSKE